MTHPILVTGAAGGQQGATGGHIAKHLLDMGLPVRAFVRKMDDRANGLRKAGADIFVGDLLDPASVREAMEGVRRAYFTYPVADGLMEAATIFASTARTSGVERLVNNSQLELAAEGLVSDDLAAAPTRRNLQHRLTDRIFDWAQVGAVHVTAPPYYENVRAVVGRTVATQDTVFLPWGAGDAVFPLTAGADVARVAATLLAGDDPPSRNVFPLVSEVVSVHQLVETLGKVLERQLKYVPITDEQWVDSARERINPHAVDHLSKLWRYFRTQEHRTRPTQTIREVTGRNPQTLEAFFRENIRVFSPANS